VRDELLWNGDYYIQLLADVDGEPYQHGRGCLADQLFGQLLAHTTGLGYLLPAEKVRRALRSIYQHNFRSKLKGQLNFQRTFALEDEPGLLICSWPYGGRPRRPLIYADEVWTGCEYQVAAHMIYEGLVTEGRELVRATRSRYDGYKRNPWNEVEAGNHYARSMASWALVLAYSGFAYSPPERVIRFAPAGIEHDFHCFFSAGRGWGTFDRDAQGTRLNLLHGVLDISQIEVDGVRHVFDPIASLRAGDTLDVPYSR
jgi:non-lysosomal glucosylceramidase